MRRFVLAWKKFGFDGTFGKLVTYPDDLVILCRGGRAEQALQKLREMMDKLKLTVNEEKTRICKVPQETFDFLGYTFGRLYSPETGKARIGMRPSKKSIKHMVEKVHALTERTTTWQESTEVVGKLNRTLRSWANYFNVGSVSPPSTQSVPHAPSASVWPLATCVRAHRRRPGRPSRPRCLRDAPAWRP